MDEIEKLGHLIEHWMEHNEEHARVYLEWAEKAEKAGKPGLGKTLRDVASHTMKLDGLLEKAAKEAMA